MCPAAAAQLHVRQRTHRQRDPLAGQPLDERRLLFAAHAVIDALHRENVERRCVTDEERAAVLTWIGHGAAH